MNDHDSNAETEEMSLAALNERRRTLGLDPVDDVEQARAPSRQDRLNDTEGEQ